jgi:hypothetical protein
VAAGVGVVGDDVFHGNQSAGLPWTVVAAAPAAHRAAVIVLSQVLRTTGSSMTMTIAAPPTSLSARRVSTLAGWFL